MSLDARSEASGSTAGTAGPAGTAGTADPSLEPPGLSTAGTSIRAWAIALAGPLVWFGYFAVVYTLSETACTFGVLDGSWLGMPVLSLILAVVTILAAGVTATTAVVAGRVWRSSLADERESQHGAGKHRAGGSVASRDHALDFVGLLLAPLFTIAILAVGLPVLVLSPC